MVDLSRRSVASDAPKALFPEVALREVVQALTKTDLAYGQIRQAILEGHFEPGSTLDQEVLAHQLELSTTVADE